MPFVSSTGSFVALTAPPPPPASSLALAPASTSPWIYSVGDPYLYAALYRTQPEVRTVVDFLARNIAQLGLHVFRRVSDTDRVRLAGHELAAWLKEPNYATTQYRLFETLMQDMGIYFNAYWLKVPLRDPARLGLVRLPPEQMHVEGFLLPSAFVWTLPDGTERRIAPKDLVYFSGYDPCNPLMGLSPLETLRRTLSEESASSDYREAFWRNAARLEGVIERPKEAPRWTPEQKQSFREQWQLRYGGQPGQTAVLEDGMTFKPMSFSARDSELTLSRKLTREECAAAYHVPLPMVGILDHATFSNVKEQHKQLYQDTLGPWLRFLQDELQRQLLIESADTDGVYLEFNIAEKLKGSFEEQAVAIQSLVGRPVMTANEGRARLNLPAMINDPTANELAQPLNQASAGVPAGAPRTVVPPDDVAATAVLRRTWMRQRARLEKVEPAARVAAFEARRERWDRELAADLVRVYRAIGMDDDTAAREGLVLAQAINAVTAQRLHDEDDPWREASDV
jgi:HK97 family phage portal protein